MCYGGYGRQGRQAETGTYKRRGGDVRQWRYGKAETAAVETWGGEKYMRENVDGGIGQA